jgi:hypothetical protein
MPVDESRTYEDALRRVVANPGLARRLKDLKTSEQARSELGISEEMATDIKNVLVAREANATESAGAQVGRPDVLGREGVSQGAVFLNDSFAQLRHAYRLILGLSVITFTVGTGLIVVATVRSLTDPDAVSSAAIIGGIGVAQIVVLFLRNPLQDIQRAVFHAQQARVAIMSYMLGLGLVGEQAYHGKESSEDLSHLDDLTTQTLRRLRAFEEDVSRGSDQTAEPATEETRAGARPISEAP